MTDLAKDIIESSKPRTQTATVCVNGELHERVNLLTRQLIEERQAGTDDMASSQQSDIEALLDEAEACTYDFKFRAIGHEKWKALRDKHAPSVSAIKSARDKGVRPPETLDSFWPAAIAASLSVMKKATDPDEPESWQDVDWDADKVREVTADWNDAQWDELVAGCKWANEQGAILPKRSSASVRTLLSGGKSEAPEGSDGPDLSSMAGD